MPHLSSDFLNPNFWAALGHAIVNGLGVLVALCVVAGVLVMITGGTAPRNWPKKDDHDGAHGHGHAVPGHAETPHH